MQDHGPSLSTEFMRQHGLLLSSLTIRRSGLTFFFVGGVFLYLASLPPITSFSLSWQAAVIFGHSVQADDSVSSDHVRQTGSGGFPGIFDMCQVGQPLGRFVSVVVKHGSDSLLLNLIKRVRVSPRAVPISGMFHGEIRKVPL